MPARRRPRRARRARADDVGTWPVGPVATTTGTVELQVDPDDPRAATVLVNGVPSSYVALDDPARLAFEYMQVMAAVVARMPTGPVRALHLGAAGCSLARWLDHARPGSRQVAVDVDDRLLVLVREWFDLPRSPALRLRAGEAGAVLAGQRDAAWDVVVRDVFAGDVTPAHLTTRGFAGEVRRTLAPGGLLLVNCADRPPLRTARAEAATLATAFERVALVAEPGVLRGRRYGNVVLAATGPAGPDLADPGLARALRSLPVPTRLLAGDELTAFVAGARPLEDAPALADDEAVPSEEGTACDA